MQRREFLRLTGAAIPAGSVPNFKVDLLDPLHETKRESRVERAEEELDNIFEPLREAENPLKTCKQVAKEVCSIYDGIKELDEKVIDQIESANGVKSLPTEARHLLSGLEGVFEVFNSRFDIDIDSSILKSVDDLFKAAANLVPLVVSAKHAVDSACKMAELPEGSSKEDKALRQFLTSCAMLVVEVLMIQFSLGYRVSFWMTRKVANVLLVRVRGLVGLKVYALLLREVHWTVRENFADALGEVVEHIVRTTERLSNNLPKMYGSVFEEDDLKQLKKLQKEGTQELKQLADRNILDDSDSVGEGDDWGPDWLFRDNGDSLKGGVDLPF